MVQSSTQIAIIGAGFGGLAMAIRLKLAGRDDFVVLERAGDVGGTWRENTYPGCACDVESHLYSYSFAPNPYWSRTYSPQPEIWNYLRQSAATFGVTPHIRFGHDVQSASWDDDVGLWRLQTSQGELTAAVLVAALGPLTEPRLPEIPGLDTFRGVLFHSARWDHGFDPRGKRIAVIGTGASAIQFVPALQKQAGSVVLFQRSAPWVLPRMDRPIPPRLQSWLARVPGLRKLLRLKLFLVHELFGVPFWHPRFAALPRRMSRRHLERAVASPELRAKLTPPYEIGCKRILFSDDYYPALAQPNVEVVTESISAVLPNAVVTADGRSRPVDAIVCGTGFYVTEMPQADRIRGRGGRSLADVWRGSPRALDGTTVAGFPNLFVILGPNTGLGHSSVVMMIEAQVGYVLKALRRMRQRGLKAIEPRPAAQEAFNGWLQRRLRRTVWLTGRCRSWYLDRTGTSSVLWPASVMAFRRRLARFRPGDYMERP